VVPRVIKQYPHLLSSSLCYFIVIEANYAVSV